MKPAASPGRDPWEPRRDQQPSCGPLPSGLPSSGFDRLARPYRWLEYLSFGHALERCREAHLGRMTTCRHALLLGDGDGRFAARLLATNASVQVSAIDGSQAMLALLTGRARALGAGERVEIQQGNIVHLLEENSGLPRAHAADLVVSHFFLDCLSTEDVKAVAAGVRQRIAPDGEWVISEFETPSLPARLVVALLYKGFALLAGLRTQRLPAYRQALRLLGWECIAEQRFLGGLLSSTVWKATAPAPDSNAPVC